VEALNGLEKLAMAQPTSKPVGLVIDEFQRVVELGGQRAEAQLRRPSSSTRVLVTSLPVRYAVAYGDDNES